MGSLIYIMVELVLIVVLYLLFLRNHWFGWTFFAFCITFLINFILVGAMIAMSSGQVDDIEIRSSGLGESDQGIRKDLDTYIYNPKLYSMLFASLCLVGVTSVFLFRHALILKEGGIAHDLYKVYAMVIFTQSITAIITGLLSYFTRTSINEYLFAILGALLALIGIALFLLAEFAINLTYVGLILISIGSGIGWVMFPLIAYDDAGPQPFGVLLSLIFLANFWGMCTFGILFFVITENVIKPLIPIYVFFILGLIGSMVSSGISLFLDDQEINRRY
mmetsp:Transcript_28138/g.24870  ORF Transcript_28138/g.24870 Transcript_28138/m.24870 type:complete len:277 (+) Transcript_28138:647-1477(+)